MKIKKNDSVDENIIKQNFIFIDLIFSFLLDRNKDLRIKISINPRPFIVSINPLSLTLTFQITSKRFLSMISHQIGLMFPFALRKDQNVKP